MKQGDKIPVEIHGQKIAEAEIREVGDGQVTLVVPGTIVVMATQTNIAPEATLPENTAPVEGSNKETIITGVDRVSTEMDNPTSETPQPAGMAVTNPGEPGAVAQPVPGQITEDGPKAVETVQTPLPQTDVLGAEAAPDVSPTVSDNDAEPSA